MPEDQAEAGMLGAESMEEEEPWTCTWVELPQTSEEK